MSDKAKVKCIELIENDSKMSSRKIFVIPRDKNLANVFKTTIVNALNKLGYTYKIPKLKIKILNIRRMQVIIGANAILTLFLLWNFL